MENTFKNLRARFTAVDGSILVVFAHRGKRGINVGASLKRPNDKKAVPGARTTHVDDETSTGADSATAEFNRLRQEALDHGWTEKVRPPKKVRASRAAFTTIPPAPTEPAASTETAPTETAPTESEKPRNGKRKH